MAAGNFFVDFIVTIVIRYQQQAGGLLIWVVAQAKKRKEHGIGCSVWFWFCVAPDV